MVLPALGVGVGAVLGLASGQGVGKLNSKKSTLNHMDSKQILLSAVGVGVGVSVGVGLVRELVLSFKSLFVKVKSSGLEKLKDKESAHVKPEAKPESVFTTSNVQPKALDNKSEKQIRTDLIQGKEKEKLKQNTKEEKSKEVKSEVAAHIKPETKPKSVITTRPKALRIQPDNEFEKRIRTDLVQAKEINVRFDDIGALEDIKESLQELVMLPIRRPDLFTGNLLKPCRGILLFGPPGTGKTMLAKAIAREAGASFINVSMSTITSKLYGEDEKNIKALFTLASKVSPTIIFLDEVDSLLGQRTKVGETATMRKIKNEFMIHWDGLMTNPDERILLLAATNRPFDLDEAIIRRFERRIMLDLPGEENREKIIRTLLAKENVDEDLDCKELAKMTKGYTGSDLKNLCRTAAYGPMRELMNQERSTKGSEERVIRLRPLNRQDFKEAKNKVAASFAEEGVGMGELKQWNELYGEGGTRKKQQLTYFF